MVLEWASCRYLCLCVNFNFGVFGVPDVSVSLERFPFAGDFRTAFQGNGGIASCSLAIAKLVLGSAAGSFGSPIAGGGASSPPIAGSGQDKPQRSSVALVLRMTPLTLSQPGMRPRRHARDAVEAARPVKADVCNRRRTCGLTTALELSRRKKKVVLLGPSTGVGASGRNGGFVQRLAEGIENVQKRASRPRGRFFALPTRTEYVRREIAAGDPTLKMGEGWPRCHRDNGANPIAR
jgi:hypothetical protein